MSLTYLLAAPSVSSFYLLSKTQQKYEKRPKKWFSLDLKRVAARHKGGFESNQVSSLIKSQIKFLLIRKESFLFTLMSERDWSVEMLSGPCVSHV